MKPSLSPEATQIQYLTTELNYAHSKIVTQDNTIRDLEHKVKILSEALKISEEKLNSDLHSKYFGSTSSHSFCTNTCTQPSHPPPTCWPRTCPPCSWSHLWPQQTQAYSQPTPSTGPEKEINKIPSNNEELNRIAHELKDLKNDVHSIKVQLGKSVCNSEKFHSKQNNVQEEEYDVIEVVAEVHSNESSNVSVISTDDFVPSPDLEHELSQHPHDVPGQLNQSVPTNQLQ